MTLSTALFSAACSVAALNFGAAVVFRVWMARQAASLRRDSRHGVAGGNSTSAETAADTASAAAAEDTAADAEASIAGLVHADFVPEAVVVLCVRGPDPFLAETLHALARQDYSNYRLVVVVDHSQDPAWHAVQCVKRALGLNDSQLEVQELRERRSECGLKCSALLQAIASLEDDGPDPERLIVTIDSDAVPAAHWLANLVRPLAENSVGATTSNQWFEPTSLAWGAWVRSVWQAGAIVPTAILANPWAGGFAIRHRDLVDSGLLSAWKTSIIDDGPVRDSLQRIGKRVVFVPQNVVINREDCGIGFSLRYIRRMLTWSRLYERTFWLTCCHAALVAGVHVWATLAALTGLLAGVAGTLGATDVLLACVPLLLLIGGQVCGYEVVRQAVRCRSEMDGLGCRSELEGSSIGSHVSSQGVAWPWRPLLVAAAIPWTMLAYALGCVGAWRVRRVVWRQIAYEVTDGQQVRMLDYAPFPAVAPQPLEHHSV